MDTICRDIDALLSYGHKKGLIDPRDIIFCRNAMLSRLKLDGYVSPGAEEADNRGLTEILTGILDWAAERGVIEDTGANRDLFDTSLMGLITPLPSVVIDRFSGLMKNSPKAATDYFYKLCRDVDYIRTERVSRDLRWTADTEFGALDLTINLSKPERDPRDIAAAAARTLVTDGEYPECLICAENEGYAGTLTHPARQNLRVIPIEIVDKPWGFQYSPYVYYNEHCILFNKRHVPMVMDELTFRKLLSFVEKFPHYFMGSNAELPIVGGSILSHEHFQGGRYEFAMERAGISRHFGLSGFSRVEAGIVNWPMSVIRLANPDPDKLALAAGYVLERWRSYTDASAFIFAETDGIPHNTVTPIARMRGGRFELDLVLRNNITTEEHPLGRFHPHAELHNIKRENIGLIEVMGLAVLPGRLKSEMEAVARAVLEGRDLSADESARMHAAWYGRMQSEAPADISEDNAGEVLRGYIGRSFAEILRHAGVFSQDELGQAAFQRFIEQL